VISSRRVKLSSAWPVPFVPGRQPRPQRTNFLHSATPLSHLQHFHQSTCHSKGRSYECSSAQATVVGLPIPIVLWKEPLAVAIIQSTSVTSMRLDAGTLPTTARASWVPNKAKLEGQRLSVNVDIGSAGVNMVKTQVIAMVLVKVV
jgi:hypothetical protein